LAERREAERGGERKGGMDTHRHVQQRVGVECDGELHHGTLEVSS
jgi:hypothetical protein